ncbi:MAG: hypothetical protein WCC37_24755 [Candidatus Sulfotelmatobacter sp.]|jgi:hypothetical protein
MVLSIPPLMVFIPAVLAFGVKITAPGIGLGAVIAMVMDCSVQVRLRLFDGVLTPRSVIGMGQRRRCYKHEQRPRYYCHDCTFSNSLHQGFLLSVVGRRRLADVWEIYHEPDCALVDV